ncbi:MAG TPA: GEVED domain-containing protein, partial [Thermoanaerobaculia bacterium]|nr:GEVED domain-containing protein [Thermoanaerobaculia bacterium]
VGGNVSCWIDFNADGEVEDYAVTIAGSDFGDAPDSYATLFASNGPRHVVVSGFSLGTTVDADADGQPTAGASGDGADEDGAIASEGFACGGLTYNVTLTNSAGIAAPRLDAWIDFDGDGAFNEPRDRIHTAVPLVAGSNMVHTTIPCDVVTRSTYARFRLSDGGGASASGAGGVGEVEDYAFALHGLDYGDAPAPHPTLRADEGARHVVLLSGNPILGSSVDEESDGQPNGTATGDDANGIDDEDGVTAPAALVAATTGSITVTAGTVGGNVSCWIDFNADGDWTDAGERIVTDLALAANASASPAFAVPADAARGTAFLRCRISTFTGLGPAFLALNGEVEDHAVTITAYDFGDAPDPLYPTRLASNGARHQLAATNNPTLGPTVDADADGQPSAAFDGDDATFTDDENGVTFPGVLLPSTNGTLTLTAGATGGIVRCWIDFNRDGDWNDDGEQVVNDLTIGANASASPSFVVPAGASNGVAAVRCRMSTLGGLTPAGEAPDGEVEDHAAIIGSVDLGDAPASYGTTLANDGPRHGVVSGFSLGATIDAESDGQPSAAADGDGADEDGVVIPAALTACSTANLTVVLTNTAAIATPNLDAWIDFDADGIFEPAERIIDSVLVAGTNDIPINVPCSVPTATTYARFRLSSTGVNTPLGAAVDGEVEDFVVMLQGLDFGDAADPSFPTLLASNGARHVVLAANNPTLGTSADTEPNGAASAGATGDDTAGVDDEDGVTFGPMIAGTPASVTIATGATGGIVNLWIDLDQDGDWSDAGEHVVVEQTLGAHASQPYSFLVPVSAVPGAMTARARISSQAGLGVTGLASDGEVEDHVAVILGAEPRIEVTMDLVSSTFAGPCGSYDVVFDVTLQNLGNVTLTNVQAETPLASVFIAPATYAITSITSGELAVDPSYDGASQPRLLLPGATLAPGQSATIRVALRLDATCQNVTYQVITTASGDAPDGSTVTDESEEGEAPVPVAGAASIPTVETWGLIAIATLLAFAALRRIM